MPKKQAASEGASLDMFGEAVPSRPVPVEFRTLTGQIKAQTLKAVRWYAIENGLKLTASSPLPAVWFENRDGELVKTDLDEITKDYAAFKKASHGRKRAA